MGRVKAATQRRREALSWVMDQLPSDRFTTHDVMMMAEMLRDATWPPYTKQAWRRISRSMDTLGSFLSRHPEVAKDEGVAESWAHGVRVRSQRWVRRIPE